MHTNTITYRLLVLIYMGFSKCRLFVPLISFFLSFQMHLGMDEHLRFLLNAICCLFECPCRDHSFQPVGRSLRQTVKAILIVGGRGPFLKPLMFKIFMHHIFLLSNTLHGKYFWQLTSSLIGQKRTHSGFRCSSGFSSPPPPFTDHSCILSGPPFRLHFFDDVCPSFCLCHVIVFTCVHVWVCVDVSVFHCSLMYYCAAILILLDSAHSKKKDKTNMAA